MPPSPSWKVVYAIIERGAHRHWLRVGLAFPNRDGSLNVRLDAVPLSGQLQIRDPASRPEEGEPIADPRDAAPQIDSPTPTAGTDRKRRP